MAQIDLDGLSFFDLYFGDIIEVFINGVPRQYTHATFNGRLHVIIVPDFVEKDDLPFL